MTTTLDTPPLRRATGRPSTVRARGARHARRTRTDGSLLVLYLSGVLTAGVALAGGGAPAAQPSADRVSEAAPRPVEPAPGSVERPRMGPPPPGYVRILGDATPDWRGFDRRVPLRAGADVWQELGPRPIQGEFWSGDDEASGRVVSIAPHPTDPLTIYIGSASGGVWKTTDAGGSWTPISDGLPNLNHGCVALDPGQPETVYAGTGEYTTQSGGDGLFRSLDGGMSWQRVATAAETGTNCSRFLVDPTSSSTLHWAGSQGYVRSTDGGTTWNRTLTGFVSDLAIDPTNPQRLFAGRHGQGIYRSLDGGATWTELTNGLPASGFSRIVLAMAPSDPDVVYAALITGGSLLGLYKTTDGGASWIRKGSTPNFPSPQAWYDCFLGVDPVSADAVWAGGVFPTYAVAGVIRSTDGGDSWTDVTVGALGGQLHPDQHAIAFGADGRAWVGNDGGVWSSVDGGMTWLNHNATLAVTQNYSIALHPTDPSGMMGGTQDNGTVGRELGTDAWPQLLAGDGGDLAYDADDPDRRYATYVRLTVYRRSPGSTFWQTITGPWGGQPVNFIAPLTMDPNDSRTLLGGTNRVWRTTNADTSATWSEISPSFGSTINVIAVAEGASDTIYVGLGGGGGVHVTTDTVSWLDRSAGLPGGQISDIVIDPADPARAYVGSYRTTGARIHRTDDYGLTWTDVTGDLGAGLAAKTLAVDWRRTPDLLWVGTGAGVYSSADGGASWSIDGVGLPNVNIGDLEIDPARDRLVAGTYGRGVWFREIETLDIFADGFESGDTATWSGSSGD